MSTRFTTAGCAVMGKNALEDAAGRIAAMGDKALIVTGKHIAASGLTELLTDLLEQRSIGYFVFDGITGEPTDRMVEMAVSVFARERCDFIIGFGGGSPLDGAKACAVMSVLPGRISDYAGKEITGDFPPFVLIPTTAGTGSEVTKFTVITDTATEVKMLLKGDSLLPTLAVIDPKLTYSAPENVVAATGIDALTHAVEAYTSRRATPLTDILALSAIKRIFTYLPRSYGNREDQEAHDEMAIAAYEAGLCINNSSVTIVHGMSRPIGALFHIPHGVSNAMLIVACLDYVLDGCYNRFAEIARQIGVADSNLGDEEAAHRFIDALRKLIGTVGIPTIREYGTDMGRFKTLCDKMADDALASGSPANTRKDLSKKDILAIYKQVMEDAKAPM